VTEHPAPGAAPLPLPAPPPDRALTRVLAYNIRALRDSRHAAPAVVRACAPDLACLQESPRFLRWRTRRAAIAREAGMVVVTGGRPAAGNLLLSSLRTEVVHAEDVLLTPSRGLHQRGLALAVVDLGGARLAVAATHLGLAKAERARHVPEVLGHLDRVATRFAAGHRVLAGDLNEPAGGRTWSALCAELMDAHEQAGWGGRETYSARAPERRIDGVLCSPGVEVVRCGVPDVARMREASDHLPVLADLAVRTS